MMNRKIFISVSLFAFMATGSIVAQNNTKNASTDLKWYTLEEAVKLNDKQPKKFLIDIYTDWCGWCKKMDADTFKDPKIAAYIKEHFYPVKFNAESRTPVSFLGKTYAGATPQGNRMSPHKFAVALFNGQGIGYPAIAYMTEKLELISTVPGYKRPAEIEPLLHYIAENGFKTESYDKYLEKNKRH